MQQLITALIIDDERLARNALRTKLEAFPEIEIVGEASNVKNAQAAIEEHNPDLLFLDIQLYNETGFDLLDSIKYEGKIIFVTAHDEFAIRAFEINAVDYILKPISSERLKNAITRLNTAYKKREYKTDPFNYEDRILIICGERMKFIKLENLSHITASGDFTGLSTGDGNEYISSKSMNEWEDRLPEKYFLRIHRSTIINIDFIEKAEKWFNYSSLIKLRGVENPFKVSRSYFKKIKERFS
jgi:two-component system, LytTR family, response regulator